MALPASGSISLSAVNTELALSSTAQITMNDAAVRTLFGVASGAITMNNGYGKSNTIPFTGFNTISNFNGSTTTTTYMYGGASNSSGRLVAVGYRASTSSPFYQVPISSYSDNGTTWSTPATMGSPSSGYYYFYDVTCTSANLYVAVGYFTTTGSDGYACFSTSTDGATWTTPAQMGPGASAKYQMWGVTTNSSGTLVATGYGDFGVTGTLAIQSSSTNGTTWTTPTNVNGTTTFSMMRRAGCNTSGRFIIVGRGAGGPPASSYSDNGTSWTTPANIGSINGTLFNVVCSSSGRWVAVGSTNLNGSNGIAIYATSTDGVTWSSGYMNTSSSYGDMWGVAVDKNGKFVAVGNSTYPTNQAVYSTSTDGSTWTTLAAVSPGGVNNYTLWDLAVQPTTGKMCGIGTYASGPYGIQVLSN